MVRVSRRVVIGRMTTRTSIGRVVVIPVVAGSTIAGNGRVCPVQRIIIVVNRECSRFPARRSGMAHRAIRGDIQRRVIGISGLVKIRRVAACAGVGCIRVIPLMTSVAIIRDGHVCARKRIDRLVVKTRWRPGSFAVAYGTIRGKLSCCVVRISGCVIIRRVTTRTSIRRIGVVA